MARLTGVIAGLIAGLVFSMFYVVLLSAEVKGLEKELVDKEISLNVLNLSNQELRDSNELHVSNFNTNGLYNEFYGSLILINYYTGSLGEQTSAWNYGDNVYVEYFKEELDTYKIQLDNTRSLYTGLNGTVSNLWVYLDEDHEVKELIDLLDENLLTFETAYSEMLANE